MFRIGVLASTKGTDLQAIIDEMKSGKMPGIELAVVLSNKKDCYALARARAQDFPAIFVSPKNKDGTTRTREQFDQRLVELLKKYKINLVVLVGYMRILTPGFVRQFPKKIINVHPALIPKFCGEKFFGANVHEAVLAAHETLSGMTIHFVEEGVDTGEIILQKTCPVFPNDTPNTLKERVQILEKQWYPEVIRNLATK